MVSQNFFELKNSLIPARWQCKTVPNIILSLSDSCSREELSEPSNANVVFSLLAHMHGLHPPVHLLGEPRPAIFPYIDRLVESALKSNSASADLKKRLFNAKLIFDQKVIPVLLALNSPIVFAHNDAQVFSKSFSSTIIFSSCLWFIMQEGNVLRMNDGTLMLIDYEYASYSYRGYDLANTLCEMSLDNVAPTETGFQVQNIPNLSSSKLTFSCSCVQIWYQQLRSDVRWRQHIWTHNRNVARKLRRPMPWMLLYLRWTDFKSPRTCCGLPGPLPSPAPVTLPLAILSMPKQDWLFSTVKPNRFED